MKPFFIFLLCLVHFILPSQNFCAKTLHAILVTDNIHDITTMTQPDLQRWQYELRSIAKHTHMNLKEKVFCGDNFQKQCVQQYLKGLSVEPTDTVVFYFSGHGYRTNQKKTPWPFITLEFYKTGLDIQWIADSIRHKNPKFTLVMTDCCNNFQLPGACNAKSKKINVNLPSTTPYYAGYQQLFSQAKGCIVISSCSEGQFSYGSYLGGLYTQCFFASLNREISQQTPSWKNLLQRANHYIGSIQRPICKVYR